MVVTNTLRGNLAFREEGGTINNVTLYYVNQRAGGFFDTIGLAYKITNPERSFIMTLKNNNIIDKMGFGFFHNMKDITSKGELVFGEVPEKYYKDRYSFSCRINDKKEVWGCGISGLSINDNEFKFTANKVYGVFQSHSINISVPPKVFHWITDEVFSKYINDKKCVLDRYYISCFENQLDDFKGVFYKNHGLTGAYAVSILALAGIPITSGFIAKIYLLTAITNSGLIFVPFLLALLLLTVVALYYYLKILLPLFAECDKNTFVPTLNANFSQKFVLVVTTIVTMLIGIYPEKIIELCRFIAYNI